MEHNDGVAGFSLKFEYFLFFTLKTKCSLMVILK